MVYHVKMVIFLMSVPRIRTKIVMVYLIDRIVAGIYKQGYSYKNCYGLSG